MNDIQPGRRFRLVEMGPDPAPVPAGSCGTIRSIVGSHHGGDTVFHLNVEWDDEVARSLNLVVPPDRIEMLEEDEGG